MDTEALTSGPLAIIVGIILFCLGLFYAIVAAMVPFWIYDIRKYLIEVNNKMGSLAAQRSQSTELQTAIRDLRTVKQLMTGETTPEAEQERARLAEEARAMGTDIPIERHKPRKKTEPIPVPEPAPAEGETTVSDSCQPSSQET